MRTVHRRLPTSRKELSARSWRPPRYSWRRSNSSPSEHRSGRTAPIRVLSPWHTARQSTWTAGLRLNVRFASEAADARYGQDYQVLVGGHQPRALGKPVQALLVPTIHATVPRRGMIEVHRVHVKYMISCRDS